MTRPPDIEEWAWEMASSVEQNAIRKQPISYKGFLGNAPNLVVVKAIAHALMTAKAEQREADAMICGEISQGYISAAYGSGQPRSKTQERIGCVACANAIRKATDDE